MRAILLASAAATIELLSTVDSRQGAGSSPRVGESIVGTVVGPCSPPAGNDRNINRIRPISGFLPLRQLHSGTFLASTPLRDSDPNLAAVRVIARHAELRNVSLEFHSRIICYDDVLARLDESSNKLVARGLYGGRDRKAAAVALERKFMSRKLIWTVLSYIIVALLAAAMALYDRIPRVAHSCVNGVHVVSQNSFGDSVRMKQEICGGMAFSATISLELQKQGSESPTVFFTYERNNSEPRIAWTARDALAVDIADVGHIYRQEKEVDGVTVRYRIGHAVE